MSSYKYSENAARVIDMRDWLDELVKAGHGDAIFMVWQGDDALEVSSKPHVYDAETLDRVYGGDILYILEEEYDGEIVAVGRW